MGFFSKLRKGLEKTKNSLIQNIETVVRGYAKIDDDMYDDLEAVMLTGDIGVETTEYLLDQIRTGVKDREIKDGNDVVPYLERCIVKLLNENDEPLPETDGTRVIFVVGVNCVG
ncbi:MAG: signal recognition particle receptor subunit alpha, partial [Megasphaera sp.]|nr:signal recognition particle receptor subunit alpha [Megasphaera sp.]